MNKKSKIFIAGHNGMVGSAILRNLKIKGYSNILTINKLKLNLLDQKKTFNFLNKNKFEVIFICAAKVGGIYANDNFSADFIYENLQIQNNLIHGAHLNNVKKLIFLGSSCIYPKLCKQPIKEDYLFSGKLEKTNDAYATAKIAGIKMCESYNKQYGHNFISLLPCNLYGPNDNYDLENSHFFPALLRKLYEAKLFNKKKIILWGDGTPKRELMHVDDFANACIMFTNKKINHSVINVGSGREKSISKFAREIMRLLNYEVDIQYNLKMPNGTPRKILDSSLANSYGWYPKITLTEGIRDVILDLKKIY